MIRPFWPALSQLIAAVVATQKRAEVYQGVSNGSGQYSVIFAAPYPVPPHVEPQILPQSSPNQSVRVTAVSVNGFTVLAEQRATLNVLAVNVLASSPTPLAGAQLSVIVREV